VAQPFLFSVSICPFLLKNTAEWYKRPTGRGVYWPSAYFLANHFRTRPTASGDAGSGFEKMITRLTGRLIVVAKNPKEKIKNEH
tara:strand:- start:90 stop:341 length:252 start_codon:yes stop_codon:yes gene_type:complete